MSNRATFENGRSRARGGRRCKFHATSVPFSCSAVTALTARQRLARLFLRHREAVEEEHRSPETKEGSERQCYSMPTARRPRRGEQRVTPTTKKSSRDTIFEVLVESRVAHPAPPSPAAPALANRRYEEADERLQATRPRRMVTKH